MCLIKRKILSGNFYNWIEESFDLHALKLISVKLSFRMRQLEFMSEWFNWFIICRICVLASFEHIRKLIYWRNKDIFPWLSLVKFPEFPDLADTFLINWGRGVWGWGVLINGWVGIFSKKKNDRSVAVRIFGIAWLCLTNNSEKSA